jgi:hypothetical protein
MFQYQATEQFVLHRNVQTFEAGIWYDITVEIDTDADTCRAESFSFEISTAGEIWAESWLLPNLRVEVTTTATLAGVKRVGERLRVTYKSAEACEIALRLNWTAEK